MAHFILVHGMFHGGWCWAPLADRLRDSGHVVDTPDLAGCGPDTTPAGSVTLDGWARSVADLVEQASGPVVLVGHSRGGVVISRVAELVPDRVAALVYVAALMIPPGIAVMELPGIVAEEGFEMEPGDMTELDFTADGTAARLKPDAIARLYAPVEADVRDWALPQLTAEPIGPLLTKLELSEERYGRVPRIYIAASRDRLLPYPAQQAMIARSRPAEVHVIDAEHQVILTHVERLVTLLQDVAARYPR